MNHDSYHENYCRAEEWSLVEMAETILTLDFFFFKMAIVHSKFIRKLPGGKVKTRRRPLI